VLTLSTNHCSNQLALSLAKSKQNMANIPFCPAYLAADLALIALAIISFTASFCLGGGGGVDNGGDNGGDDDGNNARKGDGRDAGGEGWVGRVLVEDAEAVAAAVLDMLATLPVSTPVLIGRVAGMSNKSNIS
jgi:hypothetical protein